MSSQSKRIEDLDLTDVESFSVWQFTNEDSEAGDTIVRPIKQTPVKNLNGRVAATQVRLSNGTRIWALIGNVDTENPRLTEHFLTLSVFRGGEWFTMARYHDSDAAERGPTALARFLGLTVDEVFPISSDSSKLSLGEI